MQGTTDVHFPNSEVIQKSKPAADNGSCGWVQTLWHGKLRDCLESPGNLNLLVKVAFEDFFQEIASIAPSAHNYWS